MVRAWPSTLLALTGALGLAQIGKNGKILGLKNQLKIRKKFEIFFLIFFCSRCSLGPPKMQLRSFFEKSQLNFESLLFPSGEF